MDSRGRSSGDEGLVPMKPISGRDIAFELARSAATFSLRTWQARRSADSALRRRHTEDLEQEMDNARYWFGVLVDDARSSGPVLGSLVEAVHRLLDHSVLMLAVSRQSEDGEKRDTF